MIRTLYFDPLEDVPREGQIDHPRQVAELIETVLRRSSGRGYSAAELIREDRSSISLGTDGQWAALVYVDPLGASHHSLGHRGGDKVLVYDYLGSWTEAPGDWLVPLADGIESMEHFVRGQSPDTERVVFQPD